VGEVVQIDDPFFYVTGDEGQIVGVSWQRTKGADIVTIMRDGTLNAVTHLTNMQNHEMRQLMIMWLALEHPDCLNFDPLEEENKIREETR